MLSNLPASLAAFVDLSVRSLFLPPFQVFPLVSVEAVVVRIVHLTDADGGSPGAPGGGDPHRPLQFSELGA